MKQSKRELWERIKAESPDVAEFILKVKEVFGCANLVEYECEVDEWYGDR